MLGTTLGGRYQIYRYLGGGGFGRTYLARDQHLPGTPDCVVKQLQPCINHPRAYDTACRLFNQEAEVLYLLGEHARIPRLFAHFEEQQEFYLVQEFVDGDVLSRSLRTDHCMGEVEVWHLLKELLTILAFVHEQRVIHRDIKPSNLMRRRDGALMVIDFGGVKQINSDPDGDWTATTMAIGSAGYMPNEQLAGRPRYSSDIYAAGMVALRAVTGRSPCKLPEDIRS
ncbi:MAG: serine/threonine-protein kinase, partial [Leptolyngbyaceae bacterium]|nr:serine/threonine-protein kinase [Leptolyngbyaceae bacterium]